MAAGMEALRAVLPAETWWALYARWLSAPGAQAHWSGRVVGGLGAAWGRQRQQQLSTMVLRVPTALVYISLHSVAPLHAAGSISADAEAQWQALAGAVLAWAADPSSLALEDEAGRLRPPHLPRPSGESSDSRLLVCNWLVPLFGLWAIHLPEHLPESCPINRAPLLSSCSPVCRFWHYHRHHPAAPAQHGQRAGRAGRLAAATALGAPPPAREPVCVGAQGAAATGAGGSAAAARSGGSQHWAR